VAWLGVLTDKPHLQEHIRGLLALVAIQTLPFHAACSACSFSRAAACWHKPPARQVCPDNSAALPMRRWQAHPLPGHAARLHDAANVIAAAARCSCPAGAASRRFMGARRSTSAHSCRAKCAAGCCCAADCLRSASAWARTHAAGAPPPCTARRAAQPRSPSPLAIAFSTSSIYDLSCFDVFLCGPAQAPPRRILLHLTTSSTA